MEVTLDCPELTDLDVSACLERVRQRDETAIRALITYMYPLVFKIVRSNLSPRGEEEDLIQTIMTKVFRKLDQFTGKVPFKHWVSRIAVNACMDVVRYEKARPEVRLADLGEEAAKVVETLTTSHDELDPSLGVAARDLVQQLVACLRPFDRMLIRLVYLEGFTAEEAGAATGMTSQAVAVRVSRAKVKMRERHKRLLKGNVP